MVSTEQTSDVPSWRLLILLARYLHRGRHRGQLAPHLNGPAAFAEWERRGDLLVAEFEAWIQRDLAEARRRQLEALLPPIEPELQVDLSLWLPR
jgi:hypothetical protein